MIAMRPIFVALAAVVVALIMSLSATRAQEEDPAAAADAEDNRIEILSYTIVGGLSAPDPLTSSPGDPESGRAVFFDAELGGCVVCHWAPGVEAERDSLSGPPLDDVGARYSRGVIRLWIINPRAIREDPGMPAYYSLSMERERRPGDSPDLLGPLLTAQEVEDLVAYLESLSAPLTPIGGEN